MAASKSVIVFTGGGSGGHVVPALTLIEELGARGGWDIRYVGSKKGVERDWVEKRGTPYHGVSTGKLRRYWSWENVADVFRLTVGVIQALLFLRHFSRRRILVFSTGGFVSLPVVLAAWLGRKKIYLHEQTSRAGLANRIGGLFADRVFVTFESSREFFPRHKVSVSGYPLHREFLDHKVRRTLFSEVDLSRVGRPVLLVTGGGNGSRLLNEKVREALPELVKRYFVVHQVGGAFENDYRSLKNEHYLSMGLVEEGMSDLYKMASVVLSRAGAGVVCELMALGKRSIFVPLAIAQKNEQFHNAREARRRLGSWLVEEEEFCRRDLGELLDAFRAEDGLDGGMGGFSQGGGVEFLADELEKEIEKVKKGAD